MDANMHKQLRWLRFRATGEAPRTDNKARDGTLLEAPAGAAIGDIRLHSAPAIREMVCP
jgi:hypothetical protein